MRNLPISDSSQCPVCLKRKSTTYHASLCVCKVCGTFFQIVSESNAPQTLKTEITKYPILLRQEKLAVGG
jgi:ribosomal protein L37AE/L43A